jgi:hypothetical protein
MKLIITTSLGQGWLINHPECRVDNSTHAVFFTACSANEPLHNKREKSLMSGYNPNQAQRLRPNHWTVIMM